jgi:hypothetical protein
MPQHDNERGMTMSQSMNERPQLEEPGIRLTEQQQRARRARSIAIALALGAFVIVIFVVTIVKLGGNVLTRPM